MLISLNWMTASRIHWARSQWICSPHAICILQLLDRVCLIVYVAIAFTVIFIQFTISFSHTHRRQRPTASPIVAERFTSSESFRTNTISIFGSMQLFSNLFVVRRTMQEFCVLSHTQSTHRMYIGRKVLDYWNLSHAHDTHTCVARRPRLQQQHQQHLNRHW